MKTRCDQNISKVKKGILPSTISMQIVDVREKDYVLINDQKVVSLMEIFWFMKALHDFLGLLGEAQNVGEGFI